MKILALPATRKQLRMLKAGESVLLSGTIITGRDQAHKHLVETIKRKKKLPVEIKDKVIYYVGPTPAKPGEVIGSCGPTTSKRMDKFTPSLLSRGLAAMIGKGSRSKEVIAEIKKNKAVYFVTIGGAGAYLSKRVISAKVLAYPELGPEAIFEFTVKDFPAVVGIDSRGKSIF